MKDQSSINREAIIEALELPKDLMLGRALLTMNGNRELIVENHRGLLDYQEHKVVILSREERIEVTGSGISIEFYNRDTVKLRGVFDGIRFLYDA